MPKKIILALLVAAVLIGLYKFISKPTGTPVADDTKANLILFVGNGCPHCKNVEDFIKANNIDSKLVISQKEVYYNQINQKLLNDTVKNCPKIDTSQGIGVPLAYIKDTQTCLQGDTPIIDYLKTKAGI